MSFPYTGERLGVDGASRPAALLASPARARPTGLAASGESCTCLARSRCQRGTFARGLAERGELVHTLGRQEGIHDSHTAIVSPVLEVLGEDLGDAIHLCIRPQVSVEQ